MSGIEGKLVDYILDTKYDDLPSEIVDVGKNLILTIFGTTIAGAMTEGCKALINQIKDWGGKEEATILLHGGKVPAYNAVLINSYMARALDFDDGIRPGMHVGASAVPAALAASELAGGCRGEEFLTAVAVGAEVADRINLVSDYDGFDPTGICSIFGAATVCSRILGLDRDETWNALAMAFNRSGGSFQSNIEGTLSVRLIQGFVSQGGVICAQLAKRGFTGPKNFLEGVYGYFHLYAKDRYNPEAVVDELGKRFEFQKTIFKKYPSCVDTYASTEATLDLVREINLAADDINRIDIKVTPYVYKLTGSEFKIRDNPRVDAQFNIRYCVANVLLRKNSKLEHFEAPLVRDPKIMEITKKIHVMPDPALNKRGETALEMQVLTKDGKTHKKSLDFPSGLPENPLTQEENMERFRSCISFSGGLLAQENIERLVSSVSELEGTKDVRSLIPLLLIKNASYSL
jgi:2-methylcitrate dehydratase PrpD